jgi:hypothetical protein
MRKSVFVVAILLALFLAPLAVSAGPSVYPTGTTIYKPEKCWPGFTILAGDDGRLVDMNGNLVHLWKGSNGFPGKVYPGGYLLTSSGSWKYGFQDGLDVQIRDFNNNAVWSFNKWAEGTANSGQGKIWLSRQHHDFQIKGNPVGYYIPDYGTPDLKNGTVLVLAHHNVKNDKVNKNVQLLDDVMYEVDMAKGEAVWTWKLADHFDELGFDADAVKALQSYNGKHTSEGTGFDWAHINCASYVGPNKWYEKGDQRFHPDNIIFDLREANILAILDHKTGNIVWRCGPNYREGGDKKLAWIQGQHHTHVIPKGLPGEGNIMVYDNGGWSGYGPGNDIAPDGISNMRRYSSRVIEFDPTTKDIVWEYSPKSLKIDEVLFGYKEYSPFISSAQRLPNGNTMISEGSNGRLFEVTKDLEIVWEYVSPYQYSVPPIRNITYRAYRVPYNWVPQLQKPKEVAVNPGANTTFQIPAADGSKPDIGKGKTALWEPGIGKQ